MAHDDPAASRRRSPTPFDAPSFQAPEIVDFGPEICGELEPALRREWLVTNGLGGYASCSLAGIATRRYHGLLVAALTPPVGRTVLVGAMVEWATTGEPSPERVALHAHEYADGTIDQHGYRRLQSFRLEGMLPVWTYDFGDTLLEKRVWMAAGANTTYLRYAIVRGNRPVDLELVPLVTYRDHHLLTREAAGPFDVTSVGPVGATSAGSVRAVVSPPPPRARFSVAASGGSFEPGGDWFRGFLHREESARGLDDLSDLYAIGTFRAQVLPGSPWSLVLSAEAAPDLDAEGALEAARDRQARLLEAASAETASPFVRTLVLAADQFVVARTIPGEPASAEPPEATAIRAAAPGRSVVAGYPWFNDWGRDTMIALPGLTIATGRAAEGAAILRAFARFARDGLLPNNFPDRIDEIPAYNTVDASLWYPVAIHRHVAATGDRALVDELLPTLREVLDRHVAGTRFGIGMDPTDGLLREGEEGVQLTWMDAKVDDWVVTPRRGKPVEIEALWVNALRIVGGWLVERGDSNGSGAGYLALADRATASFRSRFWRPAIGYLADVVDGPDGDDETLRPFQLFALSLPYPLVDDEVGRSVLAACGATLLTPVGLRSLAPSDAEYRGAFQGDRYARDGAYHQGTVWSWLIGAYAEAVARLSGERQAGLSVLRPFERHLRDAGLGSISEVFDGDPPHAPHGCIAQAWSVAEVLRVWRDLGGA